jgi:two-component system phosphate regulon sensor histidine kinase PhoR
MTFVLWDFSGSPFFGTPAGLFGFVLLFFCAAGLLVGLAGHFKSIRALTPARWISLLLLSLLGALAAHTFALHIPADILPPPDIPFQPQRPGLVLLSLVPAFLAGGWLGVGPAILVGLISGAARAAWETPAVLHLAYTPFEYALVAGAMAWCVRQDYRGLVGRLLRRPAICGVLLALVTWPLLYLWYYAYSATAGLVGMDYVASLVWAAAPVAVSQVAMAGIVAELASTGVPSWWPIRRGSVVPPYVSSLNRRLLFILIPLFVVGIAVLFWADINFSLRVSTSLVEDEMVRSAQNAGTEIPYFIQTGRTYVHDVARQGGWFQGDSLSESARLSQLMRAMPFFRQLTLFDAQGQPVAGFPASDRQYGLTGDEAPLVKVAIAANIPQDLTVYPSAPDDVVGVVFIAPVDDPQTQQPLGALAGRVDLVNNPLMQAAVQNLQAFAAWDGQGAIVDDKGAVIYQVGSHPLPSAFEPAQTAEPGDAVSYQDQAPDGTRRLVAYHPVVGYPWSVVIVVPYKQALQVATEIATPVNLILVVVGAVGLLLVSIIATQVTRPAEALALAAQRISEGQLDQAVTVSGEDEIGRAGLAFERMREKLRARLDELGLLLRVSQGVAGSLSLHETLPPILEGALKSTGAAGARIVLAPPDDSLETPPALEVFAVGPAAEGMAPLDAGVLALTQEEGRSGPALIENLARARAVLDVTLVAGKFEALMALPLRQENTYYGALWLGYIGPHAFTQTEVNLLTTLAGQAVVAIVNARLFESAEHGRQRLAAILASTPDAVIVTGQNDRVLLLNPAAESAFELTGRSVIGRPVAEALPHPQLAPLLLADATETSRELEMESGRTLHASVSPIISADGQVLGRVCVLRDVTHFKELDSMKSEFVATVSHDLRAPLTFMRGYATMLPMVGQLNDKQHEFGDKIILGIEQMTKLIDDLLDLGRIEAGVGLSRETCRLGDMVSEIVDSATPHAVNKGLVLSMEVPPDLPMFSGDPTLLRQAVMNLLDNAIKYTPAGGQVKVRLWLEPDKFRLAVSDTGLGISPADQVRLFQKFFRVRQRGSSQTKGSGLGLAIVKSIIERHGGRVWVESRLGKSSTFYLDLPRFSVTA